MNIFANFFARVGEFTRFAGEAFIAALESVRQPGAVLQQLYAVFIGALPLGVVTGVALGAVVWMHTYSVLARTGTVDYLPTALAAAVLLELAPIGAGLIVAARTGASLGAELGAMKLGEQLDALELFGESPTKVLVGPRVLACMLSLPLLHVFIAALALLSGFLAESVVGHTNWLHYQEACRRELYPREVIPAGFKTVVFGFLIGVAGCEAGLRATGGTEGIGRAATSGVVLACLLALASDVLLVGLIRAAG
ncbi:MlaE family ABC transporter permease [Zavarzinella formosa]|uniref:MlaE family ABC transporter permease n=1 Tax=Zavarzinella formosa TaxID=360055 RepID=UPI0002F0A1CC|nr:ABC transporter permease [Zavarzinella formosa]